MGRFSKGEEVLLRSVLDPSLNCECVVLEVLDVVSMRNGKNLYRVGIVGPTGIDSWNESALRKKHRPSELSFKELMNVKELSYG